MTGTGPTWFKSSYSGTAGDNCVEVAISDHAVLVRDSKDADGPHLTVDRDAWARFVKFAAAQS
jgi:Domain of unknown function (DUF397)